jgi:branched-chain amino acid transport system substrate-binding protein
VALAAVLGLSVACSSSGGGSGSAAATGGAGATAAGGGELHIGAILSSTGAYAGIGAVEPPALRACAKTLKTASGQTLKIDIVNDQSDPSQAAAAAKKFVADPSIAAIIGGTATATALGIAPVVTAAKVPFLRMTPVANPAFKSPYIVSSDSPDATANASQYQAFFKSKGLSMDKVLMVFNNDASGQAVAPVYQANGVKNVELVPTSLTDFAPLVSSWKSKYDGVILAAAAQSSGYLRKSQTAAGWNVPTLVASNAYGTTLLSTAGATINGAYVLTPPSALDPANITDPAVKAEVTRFHAAYLAETNTDARNAPALAANAWDQCLSVSLAATTQATGSAARAGIASALFTEKFAGASGQVARDVAKDPFGNGLIASSLSVSLIQDGKLTPAT